MARVSKRRNRYVLDFYDNQGRRRWETMPKGTTLKAAKAKLREIENQLNSGTWLPEKRIPKFKEVAADWIQHKRQSLRASTWAVYEGHTRNHFAYFDDLKINRITTAKIEKWMNRRAAEGMNLSTLRKITVSLGQIFGYAVRHGYITSNPVTAAERPRRQGRPSGKRIRVLSPEQIAAFLEAVDIQKYRVLFTLAVFTGARQGELLGLKWTDIIWTASQVHIQRTFNNGQWYEPKTVTSRRKIDLGPSVLQNLRRWRLACPRSQLDLIFPNAMGQPMNHTNMRTRHFKPALKRAKLPEIRFHDLRHTYASLLIEQGENIKYIQSQLGHASPTVTLNVYAHLMRPTNAAAARHLEDLIFQTGSNLVATTKKGVTLKLVTP